MDTTDSLGDILNSWKEIARYLGRGVRTVQRWEKELGLPVRRPRGIPRSAVVATRKDLETWIGNRPKQENGHVNGEAASETSVSPLQDTILLSRGLRMRSRQLRSEMSLAVRALASN